MTCRQHNIVDSSILFSLNLNRLIIFAVLVMKYPMVCVQRYFITDKSLFIGTQSLTQCDSSRLILIASHADVISKQSDDPAHVTN